MAQTSVSIRMDAELKRQFEEVCADLGMSMTTAFTIYVKKVLQEDRIPFEISRNVQNKDMRQDIQD